MKKIFILLFSVFAFANLNAQTQVAIGPQSASFTSMVRGYHFTAPVNFTICGIYVAPDMSTAAQNCAIVRFTAAAPPAFPGTTNAFTNLFQNQNYVPNSMIACNVPVTAGQIIGVYGSRGNTCINSYDGANFATTIAGFPTTLQRSGMQSCLQAVGMQNIWSEVNNPCGRVFIYYNCCPTPTVTGTATPTSVCSGMNVAILGGGASTYTLTPGNIVGNPMNVTPTVSTNYTVTGTSTAGCVGSGTVAVTVNPNPTVTAVAAPAAICAGQTSNLTAGGASTYTWQPGNIVGAVVTVTPPATQIYTVTGTSAAGCTGTRTVQVTVNPLPVVVPGSNSPVCLGGNINLTVGANTTYTWTGPNAFTSNLQNPTITNATTLMSGAYTVSVTNAAGCVSSNVVNVIVNTLPVITPTNTGPYCAGTTINLSTPASVTYTWTGPNAFTSNLQNPTIPNSQAVHAGTYSLTVTNGGGCQSSGTTNVIVNPTPTATAANNGPICSGFALNLTGGGGGTYVWSGPGFNSTTQSPSIASSSVANSGTYTLTVTNASGCTNSITTAVTVNALPIIAVTNPTNCVNTTINLTSNGGVTYAWTGPGGFTSAAQNPNITGAQLTMSGTYVVTVTDANGCVSTANANVSVLPLPTPNIASNSPVCAGQTLNLFGSGGANYAWSGPGYTGLLQNPTINNVTAAANGVYTLLVSSGTCTASTTFTVLINPVPVFNFAGSNVLCNGQSNGTSTVNVTVGTGPFNYNWSTIPTQTTQDATGLAAGTYSCIVTDANGCSSVASTQITQPTVFTVIVNSATTQACANTAINVNAVGAGGTGPYNYNWVSGPSTPNYSINEIAAGNYNYVVNATDAFNCPATANVNLTFHPQPTVTATSATVCAGQSTNLTASGAMTYIWQPGNITGATYPFSGNTSINVMVIGTANGCSNSANTNIVVNQNPNASINTSSNRGCAPSCVTFTAGGSSNITSYGWVINGAGISGDQNASFCFPESGTFTLGLSVVDANGCAGLASPVNIDVYPNPVADFNHAPLKPIINQDPLVTFTDASYGATVVSWNWYFMNTAQYTSILQNPTFAYTEPGTYPVVLVVKSDNGCIDTLVRPLVVGEDFGIYVPNTFTPNGDGLNDIFLAKGFGVVKYELNIFDRWGGKVFSTTDFEKGWDGTMQSKNDVKYGILEEGTYSWIINATSVFGKSHELKGHVILMK